MPENTILPPNIEGLATLLVLQDELKKITNITEFGYFVTNETRRLLEYHTAYVWKKSEFPTIQLLAQSGIAEIDMQAPVNQWMAKFIDKTQDAGLEKKIQDFNFSSQDNVEEKKLILDHNIKDNWPAETPLNVLWAPLLNNMHELSGGLVFFRERPFSEQEKKMYSWLNNNYQYTWSVLVKTSKLSVKDSLKKKYASISIFLLVTAALAFPIRLSVVATAVVEGKNQSMVNSPIPGVIKEFLVKPGELVKAGQALVLLDDRDLINSVEVNSKKVLLSEAKLRSAVQQGFTKQEMRAEIPIIQAEIVMDKAELDYTKDILEKTKIVSPKDGVVLFDSKEDWIGQPVQMGETILTVADPSEVLLKITLPVSDLISVEEGSIGKFYLYGEFSDEKVVLTSISFNAKMTPSKILAYQLYAKFEDPKAILRLGSQGNVRLYGQKVPLIYYLLRRPLQTLRIMFGL